MIMNLIIKCYVKDFKKLEAAVVAIWEAIGDA